MRSTRYLTVKPPGDSGAGKPAAGPGYTLPSRSSRSHAPPGSIVACARSVAYGLRKAARSRGASKDSTTRGSRSMLRSFAYIDMCPETRSSPSSPAQMTLTCGLPSALIVLRCTSGPDSISSRSSAGSTGVCVTPAIVARCHRARDVPPCCYKKNVITADELNRATLARQCMLRREALPAADAVRRLVALQAQDPASPYLALWNRLDGFDPADFDAILTDRAVVKGTLMRVTLHAVHAADYRTFREAMEPTVRASRLGDARFTSSGLTAADADVLVPDLQAGARRSGGRRDRAAGADPALPGGVRPRGSGPTTTGAG